MAVNYEKTITPGGGLMGPKRPFLVAEGSYWSLDSDGLLDIWIRGDLHSIFPGDIPWNEHRSVIRKVHFSNRITSIGAYAFSHCRQLIRIEIPGSVEYIGKDAFSFCSSLTEVVISNGVDTIGTAAFIGCENLTQIYIPSSVTSILENAFSDCKKLKKVVMPSRFNRLFFERYYGIPKGVVSFY